jgi:beta-glucanase (GH16 family)
MIRQMKKHFFAIVMTALCMAPLAGANQINWAGTQWQVRSGGGTPCATGLWSEKGVWVDQHGWLHLKITRLPSGEFACAEIISVERFGYGEYTVEVEGPIGSIDKNVVLGIFMYPPRDVGPDGTNEIDVEIARWGRPDAPQVNYTAWYRSHKGARHMATGVPDDLANAFFHIIWQPEKIRWYSSIPGTEPVTLENDLANQPQHFIINLWLLNGFDRTTQQETGFVIKSWKRSSLF